jgi:DNA primase
MNIESILIDNKIPYRLQGRDYIVKCLNPEHEDTNPSMRVDVLTGMFNCFSCGYKGNIAKRFGTVIPVVDSRVANLKSKIQKLMPKESLSIPEDAQFFELDYRGISKDTYKKYQAFTTSKIEKLDEFLTFPLRNFQGRIVAFMGRRMFGGIDPKYNTYPSKVPLPFFPDEITIYNKSIIFVEGIFDALNLIDKGLPNTVALLGVNKLNEKNIDKIMHYKILGVEKIFIVFDGDSAGQKAAKKLEQILSRHFFAERVDLPEDLDPGDMTLEQVLELKRLMYDENSSS